MSEEFQKAKIEFPFGLLGFENCKEFSLYESEYKPFLWLQSEEDKTLSFLVVDPFIFFNDYELDIDDSTLKNIGVLSPSDVVVLAIITIPGDGKSLTVNLEGPLVLNKLNNKCMQVILSDPKWTTKHSLTAESVKGGKEC